MIYVIIGFDTLGRIKVRRSKDEKGRGDGETDQDSVNGLERSIWGTPSIYTDHAIIHIICSANNIILQ